LRLFDLATGNAKGTYEVHKSYEAATVAFSPDGSTLATVGSDNTALLIDSTSGNVRQTFKIVQHGLAVAFSRDGKNLFTYSDDQTLRSFDIATGEVTKLMNDGTPLTTISVSADGKMLVLGGASRGPLMLSLPLGIRLGQDYAGDNRVMAACISADDQWIAGGANEGAIYRWKWKH
jgi:WD40 repeat protein